MKSFIVLSALLSIAAAQETDRAPRAKAAPSAGELYQSNCATCHPVPDLDFAVDRAWLGQVADTA